MESQGLDHLELGSIVSVASVPSFLQTHVAQTASSLPLLLLSLSVSLVGRHDEFWRVEQAMQKILGLRPKYFRPPYGKYNDQVLAVASQRGYTKMILWSDDTGDSGGELRSRSEWDGHVD